MGVEIERFLCVGMKGLFPRLVTWAAWMPSGDRLHFSSDQPIALGAKGESERGQSALCGRGLVRSCFGWRAVTDSGT